MVPDLTVDNNSFSINGNSVTLTLNWGQPFNNLDPIVNYTVSCSGDVTCPPNFTTTDNTTRSYIITNLTPMTKYTFSVAATNSIGSGEAGVVMITTPSEDIRTLICRYMKLYSKFLMKPNLLTEYPKVGKASWKKVEKSHVGRKIRKEIFNS